MRTRRMGVALATAALATMGLVGSASAATSAAPVPGSTDFDVTVPAHCTTYANNSTSPFDDSIGVSGSNPVQVTVGEAVTIGFTGVSVPHPRSPDDGARNVFRFRIFGPVSQYGVTDVYLDPALESLMLKALGPGAVNVYLVDGSSTLGLQPSGPLATGCTPASGQLVLLTSFTATTAPVCFGLAATIVGTSGNDTIRGTEGPDVIVARGGDDSIKGLGGDDVICGDHGNDVVDAGDGNDRVDGGYSDDTLFGRTGADVLLGGSGRDALDGGPGADFVRGGVGNRDSCVGETKAECER